MAYFDLLRNRVEEPDGIFSDDERILAQWRHLRGIGNALYLQNLGVGHGPDHQMSRTAQGIDNILIHVRKHIAEIVFLVEEQGFTYQLIAFLLMPLYLTIAAYGQDVLTVFRQHLGVGDGTFVHTPFARALTGQ